MRRKPRSSSSIWAFSQLMAHTAQARTVSPSHSLGHHETTSHSSSTHSSSSHLSPHHNTPGRTPGARAGITHSSATSPQPTAQPPSCLRRVEGEGEIQAQITVSQCECRHCYNGWKLQATVRRAKRVLGGTFSSKKPILWSTSFRQCRVPAHKGSQPASNNAPHKPWQLRPALTRGISSERPRTS
ncbi:uncharacterized protein LOC124258391 isoform X1 [Haliotis rubra]|uniref:uncharacterized protein LOC124258391 isoform X1 n=1 Tax=Haliotis rubra TaxID=36100 RepID=UPI001EE5F504|nr:uncharacterized protein LOC124258391 isoform X1 [Haliotis rubra]XP_046548445.1 uncharacterized protein LOC124258391 isoform X1 [Haliotis rubra]